MTTSKIFFLLGVLLIVLGGVALYTSHEAQAPSDAETSKVESMIVDPNWLTYSDDSVSFRYPETLPTTYIHSVDWPPKAVVSEGAPTCAEAIIISGRQHCVTTSSEGAAGSIYIDYAYATAKGGKTVTLSFTLREVQCANYDDPEKTACEQERNTFEVNAFADSILQTVTLK